MKNFTTILKVMFAAFFILLIISYTQLYGAIPPIKKEINFIHPYSESTTENNLKFRIGGISKVFTSVIILQMVDEKRIQLGTPISRFFSDIPNAKHISIEDLMSGRMEIRNYLKGGKFYEPIVSKYIFDELADEELKIYGTAEEFNDANFLVLGMIVEKVSEHSYAEELNNRIVQKISLTNTFDGTAFPSVDIAGGSELLSKWDLGSVRGAGSIISTISDILQFKTALFSHQIVSEKSLHHLVRICSESGFDLPNMGKP